MNHATGLATKLYLAVGLCLLTGCRHPTSDEFLRRTVVPSVKMNDVTLGEFAEWFSQISAERDPKNRRFSIEFRGDRPYGITIESLVNRRLTIHAENIPLWNILELATEMTETGFSIQGTRIWIVGKVY